MSEETENGFQEYDVLSADILRQHPGKCIIYCEEEKRVIGVGDDWDQAADMAEASGVQGTWHFAYSYATDQSIT